jgi:hypothetical protein
VGEQLASVRPWIDFGVSLMGVAINAVRRIGARGRQIE